MSFRRIAFWYVLFTPLAATLSVFEKIRLGEFNYTGFLWSGMFLMGVWLLVMMRTDPNRRPSPPMTHWWPWLVWFGFIWLSLSWCEQIHIAYNVQDAMQLTMPLLVGLVAERAVRTRAELQLLLRTFWVTAVGLVLFALADSTATFERLGIATQTRAAALTATLVGGVLLAGFPQRRFWPLVGWGLALFVTLITHSRMATGALVIAPVLHLGYRSLKWNVVGLVVTAGLGLAIFNSAAFQERFFYSGSGTVQDVASGDFDDAGRFDAWQLMWDKTKQNPLLGTGVGNTMEYVPKIWTDMHHIHNDYLRIIFEQGWVGLCIYLTAAACQLAILWKYIAKSDGDLKTAFAAAWLGICMLLVTSATDNTIVYNLYFTDPLFVLIGAAYGVMANERRQTALSPSYAMEVYTARVAPSGVSTGNTA